MEEVDNIIFHILRQLEINIPSEVKNLTDLSVDTIVESVAKCLNTVNQSIKTPCKLPKGISHRIEVAAQIASICKDLGYTKEVGYQTFLYHNEIDLRQVFMFLIERLPKETRGHIVSTTPTDKRSLLLQNIRRKLSEDMSAVWIPPYCNSTSKTVIGDHARVSDNQCQIKYEIDIEEGNLMQNVREIKNLRENIITKDLVTGLEECGITDSQFQKNKELIEVYDLPEKSLNTLKEEAISLRQKLNNYGIERNLNDVEFSKIQKSCAITTSEINNLQNIMDVMNKMNVSADTNISDILKKARNDLQSLLSKKDECISKNLIIRAEIEKVKKSCNLSKSKRARHTNLIQLLKEDVQQLKAEYKQKEESHIRLKNDYKILNKRGVKRSIYTKRIIEIISNITKQKIEIDKILQDTRQLQKEINNLTGQLDRSFSIADETLFQDAKKDDQAKKAYKLLALLHSECNTIVSLVNDTGTIAREIIDLEDHLEFEKSKKTEEILNKIQLDLTQLQEEAQSSIMENRCK